jgi:hypothetical protein
MGGASNFFQLSVFNGKNLKFPSKKLSKFMLLAKFTRFNIPLIRLSRMSGCALDRIIANNKIAEETLAALKREVSTENQ